MAAREGERVSGGRAQPQSCLRFRSASRNSRCDSARRFRSLSELGGVHDGLLDVERWTEMLRDVGFNSAPETAEDFIRSFIADRTARGG